MLYVLNTTFSTDCAFPHHTGKRTYTSILVIIHIPVKKVTQHNNIIYSIKKATFPLKRYILYFRTGRIGPYRAFHNETYSEAELKSRI